MDHRSLTALAPTIKELGLERFFIGPRPIIPANVSERNIYTQERNIFKRKQERIHTNEFT